MSNAEGESGHTKGAINNEFCSLRKDPCDHHSYTRPCDSVAAQWNVIAAGSHVYPEKYKDGAQLRGHQAHHILCVASVTGKITSNTDIDSIVKQTKWCVNVADNMIALPVWGHTIAWYVDLETAEIYDDGAVPAPPFADLAQHDYDHDIYLRQVDSELDLVTQRAQKAAAQHRDPSGNLAGKLNTLIKQRKPTLQKAGTHAAWKDGMENRNGDWYQPFSMVDAASARKRPFPCGKNQMMKKILAVSDAFLKL